MIQLHSRYGVRRFMIDRRGVKTGIEGHWECVKKQEQGDETLGYLSRLRTPSMT